MILFQFSLSEIANTLIYGRGSYATTALKNMPDNQSTSQSIIIVCICHKPERN